MRRRSRLRRNRTRQRVLVWCAVCDKWIGHEFAHDCTLAPAYKARRDAQRTAKHRQLARTTAR